MSNHDRRGEIYTQAMVARRFYDSGQIKKTGLPVVDERQLSVHKRRFRQQLKNINKKSG
jgi:hypothetical protein